MSFKLALNKCGLCGLGPDAHDSAIVSGAQKSANGHGDKFLSCSECLKSFHPVCLKFNTSMTQSVKKYNWQCIECKKCVICGNSENDVILFILRPFDILSFFFKCVLKHFFVLITCFISCKRTYMRQDLTFLMQILGCSLKIYFLQENCTDQLRICIKNVKSRLL